MLPVRFVAEAFGATVGWDGATSTATVKTETVTIEITIGAKTAKVNGELCLQRGKKLRPGDEVILEIDGDRRELKVDADH